jgi:hypothetical protein
MSYKDGKILSTGSIVGISSFGLLFFIGIIVLGMWGCPKYNVYKQQKEGEALLAHAQSSREVAVAEAKAKMEAATLLAQADTIRAHGIATSNKIIGQSLTDAYLHWFWIDNIDKSNNVIYVPTEANMPIMEAGRTTLKSVPIPKSE